MDRLVRGRCIWQDTHTNKPSWKRFWDTKEIKIKQLSYFYNRFVSSLFLTVLQKLWTYETICKPDTNKPTLLFPLAPDEMPLQLETAKHSDHCY